MIFRVCEETLLLNNLYLLCQEKLITYLDAKLADDYISISILIITTTLPKQFFLILSTLIFFLKTPGLDGVLVLDCVLLSLNSSCCQILLCFLSGLHST